MYNNQYVIVFTIPVLFSVYPAATLDCVYPAAILDAVHYSVSTPIYSFDISVISCDASKG
jgi:hypothetical protein